MKSIDYRNATWEEIKNNLVGLRMEVYRAWCHFGPGTTRQIAERSGLSILTLCPRSTELYQMGLLREVSETERKQIAPAGYRGGVYEVVSELDAETLFRKRQVEMVEQPELKLQSEAV